MEIISSTAIAIVIMAWLVYERDQNRNVQYQYEVEPYEIEDREN